MKVAACMLGLGLVLAVGACRSEDPKVASLPTAAQAVNTRCPDERVVDAGDSSTPEGTIFQAYTAALGPDTDDGFQAFRVLWQPDALTSHIREQIWPRVREHVGKYVAGAGDATFTLCRRVDLGGGRVKLFVKSNAPEKSDPPTILFQAGDIWVIDVMTP